MSKPKIQRTFFSLSLLIRCFSPIGELIVCPARPRVGNKVTSFQEQLSHTRLLAFVSDYSLYSLYSLYLFTSCYGDVVSLYSVFSTRLLVNIMLKIIMIRGVYSSGVCCVLLASAFIFFLPALCVCVCIYIIYFEC